MYEPKFYFCITHELIINISVSSLSDDTASTIILKKIKILIKSRPLTIAFCDLICVTDSFPRFCGQFVLSIFLLSQLGSQNYCQINFHIRHELHAPIAHSTLIMLASVYASLRCAPPIILSASIIISSSSCLLHPNQELLLPPARPSALKQRKRRRRPSRLMPITPALPLPPPLPLQRW